MNKKMRSEIVKIVAEVKGQTCANKGNCSYISLSTFEL